MTLEEVPERREARASAERLLSWLEASDLDGYDPYDALRSPLVRRLARTPRVRQLAIQSLRRSPVNPRRLLGIRPYANAKALGLIAGAAADLLRATDDERWRRLAQRAADRAGELALDVDGAVGWGYPFDVQVRWAFYPATTPNAIATVFTAAGLLNAAKGLERPDLADLAMSTSGFLDSLVTGGEERYYAYVPGVATPIHNANLLVAALRARLASIGGEEPPPDVLHAVEFSLRRQRDDGSWPYGEAANLAWVDGYHTAYVLSALADLDATYTRDDLRTALIRGTRFYVECLFNPDGSPRYTVERTYPLDAHNAATAIGSLAKLAPYEPRAADLSARVLRWTLANFQTRAGWFLYQRGRLHTKRVPYIRWSDAHMLNALADTVTRSRRASSTRGGTAPSL